MAKQIFTTGQVLTAAQLTSLQQTAMNGGAASNKTASYTLVSSDAGTAISMTSTSATTITVNTGIFSDGDTVLIQNLGSGDCTITAGTATVNTAGSLILPQYDAGILKFVSASSAVFYDFIQVGATSPLTTKGDLYGFSTSDQRIPIGANGTILTADSTENLGLKWATAASGGGMTLLSTTTLSGASVTISGISGSYKTLELQIFNVTNASSNGSFRCNPNNEPHATDFVSNKGTTTLSIDQDDVIRFSGGGGTNSPNRTNNENAWVLKIYNYASTTTRKPYLLTGGYYNGSNARVAIHQSGIIRFTSALTSLVISNDGGSLSTGTALLYGVS